MRLFYMKDRKGSLDDNYQRLEIHWNEDSVTMATLKRLFKCFSQRINSHL